MNKRRLIIAYIVVESMHLFWADFHGPQDGVMVCNSLVVPIAHSQVVFDFEVHSRWVTQKGLSHMQTSKNPRQM